MLQQSDVSVNVGFMHNMNRWLYEYENIILYRHNNALRMLKIS